MLAKKAAYVKVTTSSTNVSETKQQSYLKKADSPKWLGDPLEFADFKRRWINQVSTANLPPESELDRLRENVPSQAAKAFFGETVMADAMWIGVKARRQFQGKFEATNCHNLHCIIIPLWNYTNHRRKCRTMRWTRILPRGNVAPPLRDRKACFELD